MPVQSIDINIKNKVFNKNDFDTLIAILENAFTRRKQKSPYYKEQKLSVEITSADGISNSYDETDIKGAQIVFDRKKVTSFRATYSDYEKNNSLTFRLEDGDSIFSTNYISISSADTSWFNAKRTEINDFLSTVKNQDNVYLRHTKLIKFISYFLLGIPFVFAYLNILDLIYKYFPLNSTGIITAGTPAYYMAWVALIVIYSVLSFCMGYVFASGIFRKIDDLWPSIEFNFGPEHTNTKKIKRGILRSVITVIIVPIIISLAILPLSH